MNLLIHTVYSTGGRISEISALRRKRVDLHLGVIKIRERYSRGDFGPPKSENAERDLPLGDLLEEYRIRVAEMSAEDLVFCKPSGEPYDDRDIQQHVIKKAAKRAGIYYEGFGLHRIRSASITQLQAEGHASSIEAQKHAGHGRVSMTADYTVLGLERHRALVRALQAPLMRRPQVGVQ